jgi:acyl-CoA thioesterase-1
VTDHSLSVEPFWLSPSMRDESLLFVDRGGGPAVARLLFHPSGPVALTSASGEMIFEAERDFVVDARSGVITRTAASRIPFTTLGELYPADDPFVLIADEDDFHRRQVAATYAHDRDAWHGHVSRTAAASLPGTFQRLAAGQPLTLSLAGDSISEGYNASGYLGVPPHQPPYGALVADAVAQLGGSSVTLHNLATAGWTSDDGAADVERVAATQPDLLMIAFGMNDAGYAGAADFIVNIARIMEGVRATSPEVEFVLVSPMLPNPHWRYPIMERFPEYRDALARLCATATGAALADVTSLWRDLLIRKSVHDLTGNGINHPNDFGHRLYAQAILGLLIEPARWSEAARHG